MEKSLPVGYTHLEAGDVWKYGETTKGSGCYSLTSLQSANLVMEPIFFGTTEETKIQEKIMIYGYALINRKLPQGNKIFR